MKNTNNKNKNSKISKILDRKVVWLLKEKYNNKPTKQFYKDIERLKLQEPIDYVIGFKDFLGCKIDLSKKVLIPRVETEYWVDYIVRQNNLNNCKILDIFAGSGCIGMGVLKNNKVKVVFADNDNNAILQIKKNLKINFKKQHPDILENVRVIKSDIFEKIKGKYNFILANPPYIPTKNKNKIDKSTLKYEPQKALFGRGDGLFYIKKFLKQAKNHLLENGKIYMEFDSLQKIKIEKLIKLLNYKKYHFYKDQFNSWRWVEIENCN